MGLVPEQTQARLWNISDALARVVTSTPAILSPRSRSATHQLGLSGQSLSAAMLDDTKAELVAPLRCTPLPPVQLIHGRRRHQLTFVLPKRVLSALSDRTDVELRLTARRATAHMGACDWPRSLLVTVNGFPMSLVAPGPGRQARPINLRAALVADTNRIALTSEACACSHVFQLVLVQRVNAAELKQAVLQRADDGPYSATSSSAARGPLATCPVSRRRMLLPCRGRTCRHAQCFDLEAYLDLNRVDPRWACPICTTAVWPEDIVHDGILLRQLQADCDRHGTPAAVTVVGPPRQRPGDPLCLPSALLTLDQPGRSSSGAQLSSAASGQNASGHGSLPHMAKTARQGHAYPLDSSATFPLPRPLPRHYAAHESGVYRPLPLPQTSAKTKRPKSMGDGFAGSASTKSVSPRSNSDGESTTGGVSDDGVARGAVRSHAHSVHDYRRPPTLEEEIDDTGDVFLRGVRHSGVHSQGKRAADAAPVLSRAERGLPPAYKQPHMTVQHPASSSVRFETGMSRAHVASGGGRGAVRERRHTLSSEADLRAVAGCHQPLSLRNAGGHGLTPPSTASALAEMDGSFFGGGQRSQHGGRTADAPSRSASESRMGEEINAAAHVAAIGATQATVDRVAPGVGGAQKMAVAAATSAAAAAAGAATFVLLGGGDSASLCSGSGTDNSSEGERSPDERHGEREHEHGSADMDLSDLMLPASEELLLDSEHDKADAAFSAGFHILPFEGFDAPLGKEFHRDEMADLVSELLSDNDVAPEALGWTLVDDDGASGVGG